MVGGSGEISGAVFDFGDTRKTGRGLSSATPWCHEGCRFLEQFADFLDELRRESLEDFPEDVVDLLAGAVDGCSHARDVQALVRIDCLADFLQDAHLHAVFGHVAHDAFERVAHFGFAAIVVEPFLGSVVLQIVLGVDFVFVVVIVGLDR